MLVTDLLGVSARRARVGRLIAAVVVVGAVAGMSAAASSASAQQAPARAVHRRSGVAVAVGVESATQWLRAARVAADLPAGLAGAAVIGSPAAFVAVSCDGDRVCLSIAEPIALASVALGLAVGTTMVSRHLDGNGGLGWSLLGSLLGGGVALVLGFAVDALVGVIAMFPLMFGGAAAGYELSSDLSAAPPRPYRCPGTAFRAVFDGNTRF